MRLALMTGAGGTVGGFLRERLPRLGWDLRLLDARPLPGDAPGEAVGADIRDADALDAAMAGVDAVIHLAAISSEAPFADILSVNIDGTYQVFDAARRAGVGRIVYASSNHAVGFTPRSEHVGVDIPPRPDTHYGVSKVFGEALARLYVDRFGMQIACLRIGSWEARPTLPRQLWTWLSPDDGARLVHACLTHADLDFAIVYGISANTRAWWDLESGRALGYDPRDDAEAYAAEIGEPDPEDPVERFLGGEFTQIPLPPPR